MRKQALFKVAPKKLPTPQMDSKELPAPAGLVIKADLVEKYSFEKINVLLRFPGRESDSNRRARAGTPTTAAHTPQNTEICVDTNKSAKNRVPVSSGTKNYEHMFKTTVPHVCTPK